MISKRKTKIICTLGPATDSFEAVSKLAELGMNVARINLSHGDFKVHERRLKWLDDVNSSRKSKIASMLDTRGPEIRTGPVKGAVVLKEGSEVLVVAGGSASTPKKISLNFPNLDKVVSPKGRIYLADGNFELEVVRVERSAIRCRVNVGGRLGANKNACIPGASLNLPTLNPADLSDIKSGIRVGADFIAQSFVRGPEDVLELMELLHENGSDAHIIAKIELASAVEQIDKIVAASDGVMIARGDLGVQLPIEKIPAVQKLIIRKCNAAGKPVVVATHMLESMTVNPRPTRAEATDVANAVFDGADAVMLSGETAAGKYPFKAVQTMDAICLEAEAVQETRAPDKSEPFVKPSIATAVCHSACQLANELEAGAIITPTSRGFTAKAMSQQRPKVRIIALTPDGRVAKKLAMAWGVNAMVFGTKVNSEALMERAVEEAQRDGLLYEGELVVVTGGVPLGLSGSTNTLHVQRVENPQKTRED